MKKTIIAFACLVLALAMPAHGEKKDMKAFVADLMSRMTLDEKLGQLNLIVCPDFVSGQISDNSSKIHQQLAEGQLGGLFGFRGAEYIHRLQKEAVQLYISDDKSSVLRPAKELKGFKKVWLQPGQTQTVAFTIGRDDLSFFDAKEHKWRAEPGAFRAHVAAAADDIRSTVRFTLK